MRDFNVCSIVCRSIRPSGIDRGRKRFVFGKCPRISALEWCVFAFGSLGSAESIAEKKHAEKSLEKKLDQSYFRNRQSTCMYSAFLYSVLTSTPIGSGNEQSRLMISPPPKEITQITNILPSLSQSFNMTQIDISISPFHVGTDPNSHTHFNHCHWPSTNGLPKYNVYRAPPPPTRED